MTPIINEHLAMNHELSLCRNTDHNIAAGLTDGVVQGWTWILTQSGDPLIIVYYDDLEPIEQYFLKAYPLPTQLPMIFGGPLGLQK